MGIRESGENELDKQKPADWPQSLWDWCRAEHARLRRSPAGTAIRFAESDYSGADDTPLSDDDTEHAAAGSEPTETVTDGSASSPISAEEPIVAADMLPKILSLALDRRDGDPRVH